MNYIKIERVDPEDLPLLIQISKKTFDDTFRPNNKDEVIDNYLNTSFTKEMMLNQLKNPHSEFYFAVVNNKVAGYLKINIKDAQTENMGADSLEIERIYVDRNYHKQGIGKLLYDKAIERAHYYRVHKVWLGVWEHNHNALAFYTKLGFKHTDSHVFQMGDEAQTDFIMEYPL
ncbi:GNAT family N-acetyltransferase [Macrococcus capreoli]|uniref:GNAT family N-acetyltransferase n=1 Tax=Macrococcus capreoli TaxID=2982690 RepID=UPI0021D60D6F|nr:GNAT family N-acetyltransferase [Macrococcus sp. TMW 2.2395]MCU7556924.1 GNAT family N-acetyltransferase [Macrococcus sp. TMW 2.2395]